MIKVQFVELHLPRAARIYFMVVVFLVMQERYCLEKIFRFTKLFDYFYQIFCMLLTLPNPNNLFIQYVIVSSFRRLSLKVCAVRASVEISLSTI